MSKGARAYARAPAVPAYQVPPSTRNSVPVV